jgi:nucleoside-diphosphate-sugar epimerase
MLFVYSDSRCHNMAESYGHGAPSREVMHMKHVLDPGATGFLGAHVVYALLDGGVSVRAGTRSLDRGQRLHDARPRATDMARLEAVRIGGFAAGDGDELDSGMEGAIKGIDAVVYIASVSTDFLRMFR